MADLAPVVATVISAGTNFKTAIAGATLIQGDVIYLDSTDSNKAKLADASAAATATVAGICVTPSLSGQPVLYTAVDTIAIGATVATGEMYVLSATAGKIAPLADLVSTNIVSIIGIASSTTEIDIQLQNTGIITA